MPDYVRPRHAASLILIRRGATDAEVLLGRRHKRMRFMPGVFAFPGGALEVGDYLPSGYEENLAPQPDGLDSYTKTYVGAFAKAALRELCEETTLLLGYESEQADPKQY
ncbi:MAG: hypothetical protein R3245_09240, partial [Kiloniellales bacterium]|nr:hypothetical protein [Kiloniellales bacterium]